MTLKKLTRSFRLLTNGTPLFVGKKGVNSMPINTMDSILGLQDLKSIYKPPLNIRFESVESEDQFFECPRSTSSDTNQAKEEEKIKEETGDDKLIKEHSSLFINNFRKSDLVSIYQGNNLYERLTNNVERTLATYLYDIIIKNELLSSQASSPSIYEGRTDVSESSHSCSINFVIYLLSKLGFNEHPFSMFLNQDYTFKYDSVQSVNVKPTITVVKHFQNICLLNESFFLHNIKTEDELSECRIALDLVASASNNYHRPFGWARRRDQLVYAFRVAGSQFTFYKAIIPVSYIQYIDPVSSVTEEKDLVICKYPPERDDSENHGLDYVNEKERPSIIRVLLKLKSLLTDV